MQAHETEWVWLDTRQTVSVTELSTVCGISTAELDELVDYGALTPLDAGEAGRQFQADCIATLRTAGQLRRDYDLDLFAVAMLLDHLRLIERLEGEVRSLRARLPGSAGP